MNYLSRLFRRLAFFLWRRQRAAELADELEFHRAERQRQLERSGLTFGQASAASRRMMGNIVLAREDASNVWIRPAIEGIVQDFHYGTRALAKAPGFTLTALLTLAFGIGGSTAIFSVLNAVVLRPLPYADSARLAMIWTADPARNMHEGAVSIPTFHDWRARTRTFSDMAFWRIYSGNLTGTPESERVNTMMASANLFPLLGVRTVVGRTFSAEEERHRAEVVVLGHPLWMRRFGGNRSIVGESIVVEGHTLQVIGVMPEGFYFPSRDVQLWVPATLAIPWSSKPELAERQWAGRFADFWRVVGRLAPNVGLADAQAEMTGVGGSLAREFPNQDPDFIGFGVEVVPMLEQVIGRKLRLALWVLLGAVGCVLLIACANVANLLLARGAARSREFAVRAALGAGRARLVRQAFLENLVLAVGAGLVGAAGAVVGVPLIAAAAPSIPRFDEVAVDTTVLAFSATVSLVTGVLFGALPAVRMGGQRSAAALKEHGPSPAGHRARRTRSLLVVVECTLTVALLAGAGLLIRSALQVRAVRPGFEPRNVLVARVNLPLPVSRDWRRQEWNAFGEITERLGRLRGVVNAAAITNLLTARNPEEAITIEGRVEGRGDTAGVLVHTEDVTPGFFDVMRVPLRGRDFTNQEQNAKVAIVNEAFAQRFFGADDPIGKRFGEGTGKSRADWITIIGVAGNMHRQGLERGTAPEFFFASSEPTMDIVVRTDSNPTAVTAAVRDTIRSVVPSAVVIQTAAMDDILGEAGSERRLQTWVLASFAAVSLLLAALGVYGVMHFTVAQRAHEFAVRMALGATRRELARLVLGDGMRLPLVGLTLGLVVAVWLNRLLTHLLFGITATDPVTFAAVAVVVLAAALVACWLPARKAARVDPLVALRCE